MYQSKPVRGHSLFGYMLEGGRTFQKFPLLEQSGRFKKVVELSGNPWKLMEGYGGVWKVLVIFYIWTVSLVYKDLLYCSQPPALVSQNFHCSLVRQWPVQSLGFIHLLSLTSYLSSYLSSRVLVVVGWPCSVLQCCPNSRLELSSITPPIILFPLYLYPHLAKSLGLHLVAWFPHWTSTSSYLLPNPLYPLYTTPLSCLILT